MAEMNFTQDDRNSPTWKKIKAHIEQELVGLRVNLEADQPPERTQKLRGQIRSFVLLLSLGDVPAIANEEDED